MNGKIYFLDRPVQQLLPTDDRPLSSTKEAIVQRYNERYSTYISTADTVIDNSESAQIAAALVKRSFFE
jgi:shikimate kinase